MGMWPVSQLPNLPIYSTFSTQSIAHGIAFSGFASGAWPTANLAFYFPITLTEPFTVDRMFWFNGSTIAATNADAGIYTKDGTRIVSTGSTALSGTNTLQAAEVTNTTFGPGLFYMALALDTNTGHQFRVTTMLAEHLRGWGVFQEASAFALPATATFATMAQAYLPIFGFQNRGVL